MFVLLTNRKQGWNQEVENFLLGLSTRHPGRVVFVDTHGVQTPGPVATVVAPLPKCMRNGQGHADKLFVYFDHLGEPSPDRPQDQKFDKVLDITEPDAAAWEAAGG